MRTWMVFLWPLLLLVFAAEVQADDAGDDLARAHFEVAQAHFDSGAYEDALREFSEAYRLSGRAKLLYNLYLCHERLGDLNAAIDHLARYLDADPDAANAAALRARLEHLRRRAARPKTESAPRSASTPELPTPERSAPEAPVAQPGGSRVPWMTTALSFGGAGLVSFGVFAYLTAKEDAHLDRTCADACSERQVDDLRTYSLAADISVAVAATGLVVGGALWWSNRKKRAAQALAVAPVLRLQTVGLAAQGHF